MVKYNWNLTDNAGRVVIQNSTELRKGNNSVSINISQFVHRILLFKCYRRRN